MNNIETNDGNENYETTHKIGHQKRSFVNSIPTSWVELSGFQTKVDDDTNALDVANNSNCSTEIIQSNSPAVIVKPAYTWPNIQGSSQTKFQTKVSISIQKSFS